MRACVLEPKMERWIPDPRRCPGQVRACLPVCWLAMRDGRGFQSRAPDQHPHPEHASAFVRACSAVVVLKTGLEISFSLCWAGTCVLAVRNQLFAVQSFFFAT